jgi:hypothetical protein
VIYVVLMLVILLAAAGYALFRLLQRLFQYQDAFAQIDEFSAKIHGFTSQFEGKPLLTDAPEAVHLHRLICEVRAFFESYEVEQEAQDG